MSFSDLATHIEYARAAKGPVEAGHLVSEEMYNACKQAGKAVYFVFAVDIFMRFATQMGEMVLVRRRLEQIQAEQQSFSDLFQFRSQHDSLPAIEEGSAFVPKVLARYSSLVRGYNIFVCSIKEDHKDVFNSPDHKDVFKSILESGMEDVVHSPCNTILQTLGF